MGQCCAYESRFRKRLGVETGDLVQITITEKSAAQDSRSNANWSSPLSFHRDTSIIQ